MTKPDLADYVAIAKQLRTARRTAKPIEFVTSSFPNLTWPDARAVARRSDQLRRDDGETQIGWKLGWTSEPMRTALGIDRPNWGTLWDSQIAASELSLDHYIHPKVEPELVWQSPFDIDEVMTAEQLAGVGGEWSVGIEVVDPRFPSFNFHALDNTADNSSSAAIRLGDFTALTDDAAGIEVAFSNGKETRFGLGSQAMGSPLEAVSWLSGSLAEEGLFIKGGDIIFTGGLTAPFDAERGTPYSVRCDALSATSLLFS